MLHYVSREILYSSFSNENQIYFLNAPLTVCSWCDCRYSNPAVFPDDCVKVFDWEACKYIVHKKNDTTELCPVFISTMY